MPEEEFPNVILPSTLRARQIRKLKVGESGWAYPSALFVDSEGRCWIDINYKVEDPDQESEDEVTEDCIKIERQEEGFLVEYNSENNDKWVRENISFLDVDYAESQGFIPVIQLIPRQGSSW